MVDVLVPLAEGFEEIEAVTVIDVLRRGGVEVVVAGLLPGPVRGSRGVVVVPDTTLDEVGARRFDAVALPGGRQGAEALRDDPRVRDLLVAHAQDGRWIAAICAAPIALAAAGLTEGRTLTSHPSVRDELLGVDYREDRVVRDDKLVTSRGPGTALEFAVALLALLCGGAKASEVAGPMLPAAVRGPRG